MKRDATTVEEFLNLQHLDDALAIRAAFKVHDTMNKISSSKEKKVVTMNDLFAQEIISMAKSHMLYISFTVYR
jgi:hypothetical protein